MFYANQRKIRVNRETVSSSKSTGRLYLIAYQDNIKDAIKDLSASAFKCYLVFLMSKDNFQLDYSPEYFSTVASIHPNTARKAMKELQEKGYLIQVDEKNFNFYEYPRFNTGKNTSPVQEEVREIFDPDTGEIYKYSYSQLRKYVNEDLAKELWNGGKAI